MHNTSHTLKQEMTRTLAYMHKCGLWKKAAPIGGDPTMSAATQARPSLAEGPKRYINLDTGEESFKLKPGQSMRGNYMFTPSTKPGGIQIRPDIAKGNTYITRNPYPGDDPSIKYYRLDERTGGWNPVQSWGYTPKSQGPVTTTTPAVTRKPSRSEIERFMASDPGYNMPVKDVLDQRTSPMYDYQAADPGRWATAWNLAKQLEAKKINVSEEAADWSAALLGGSHHTGRNLAVGLPIGAGVGWLTGGSVPALMTTGFASGYLGGAAGDWNDNQAFLAAQQRVRNANTQAPAVNPFDQAARMQVGFRPGLWNVGFPAAWAFGTGYRAREKALADKRLAEKTRLEEEAKLKFPDYHDNRVRNGNGVPLDVIQDEARAKFVAQGLDKFDAPRKIPYGTNGNAISVPRHVTLPLVRDIGLSVGSSLIGDLLYQKFKRNSAVNNWERWENTNGPGTPREGFTQINISGSPVAPGAEIPSDSSAPTSPTGTGAPGTWGN